MNTEGYGYYIDPSTGESKWMSAEGNKVLQQNKKNADAAAKAEKSAATSEKVQADYAAYLAQGANTRRYNAASGLMDTALTTVGREYYTPESNPLTASVKNRQAQLEALKKQRNEMATGIKQSTATPLGAFWNNLSGGKEKAQVLSDLDAQIAAEENDLAGLASQSAGIYASASPFAAAEGRIQKTKTRDTSAGMQSLITSGLAGTETAGQLGASWESSVGSGMRADLEDQQRSAWLQALMAKAGMVTDVTDAYPDYATLAQYSQTAAMKPVA